MLFKFIRYTQPAWQFNLQPDTGGYFATCYYSGTAWGKETIDERYQTESAQKADLGYRLWNKGVLLTATTDEIIAMHRLPGPTLRDEYTFIRKYWQSHWATFALFLRLLTLNNPFKEFSAYFITRGVQRQNIFANPISHDGFDQFDSDLVKHGPLVSVIIPTLNRYNYLADVLHDLENQNYPNFDVIVVDQSDQYDASFYNGFQLKIRVIRQEDKLLWTARNRAIAETGADYLLFFDDDSRVQPDWIMQHLKCLDFFDAGISAGISLAKVGQKVSESYGYFRWADQFDSGNAMVRRSVFELTGLFDEIFNGQRMGDAEFGFRAYKMGVPSISNPRASRVHLKVSTGGLREMGHWDGFRPTKWFAPKPVPSVIYLYNKYLEKTFKRNAIFIGLLLSNIPYDKKGKRSMLLLSLFFSLIKSPILFIQYNKANKLFKKMYRKGSMIQSI